MLRRHLSAEFRRIIRKNLPGLAVLLIASAAFFVGAYVSLGNFHRNINTMFESSWVAPPNEGSDAYVTGQRYDLSQQGVQIPPARDDRLEESESAQRIKSAEYYAQDCYEQPYTAEQSDLCAQWSNAAAVRYGNLIALESHRLSTLIGFLTAFGVFLAGIGVIFAGTASYQAGRGIKMMAFGFMPALSFSVTRKRSGWVTVTVRNSGTGPASDIRVKVDGEPVKIENGRLGVGSHTTFERKVADNAIEIEGFCLDLSETSQSTRIRFVRHGDSWVVEEQQPSETK